MCGSPERDPNTGDFSCPAADPNTERCGETTLCGIAEEYNAVFETPVDAGINTPFKLVPENLPDAATPSENKAQYPIDLPCDASRCDKSLGNTHNWCRYKVEETLPNRSIAPPKPKSGKVSGGPTVDFNFDPNLTLDYTAKPGPLGIPSFDISASASVSADVALRDFMKVVRWNAKIVDVLVGLHAGFSEKACEITTKHSRVKIVGIDFLPPSFGLDIPDAASKEQCKKAYGDFQTSVDRAKKAYRDALELLRQYRAMTDTENFYDTLSGTIRDQLLPPDFPDPNLPDRELPEITINRMIAYYRDVSIPAIATAKDQLYNALHAIPTYQTGKRILPLHSNEEITIMTAQFFIGPIPAVLQVLVNVSYGIDVDAIVHLDPGAIVAPIFSSGPDPASEIAHIGIGGSPFAAAGIALFVGVGFDIGIAAATAGVEGTVQLAKITLPISGGAGIFVGTEPDTSPSGTLRLLPDDISPLVSQTDALIPRKKVVFKLGMTYSGSANLRDVLHGAINAKVKIKFFFFSKTWRKTLININGLCTGAKGCPHTLFEGTDSFDSPLKAPWGIIQMPMPFMAIPEIPPSEFRKPSDIRTRKDFDDSKVGQLFYDNLCHCLKGDEICAASANCCPETPRCFDDPDPPAGYPRNHCIDCQREGQSCNSTSDCCLGHDLTCKSLPKDTYPHDESTICAACRKYGETCKFPSDCCPLANDCFIAAGDTVKRCGVILR